MGSATALSILMSTYSYRKTQAKKLPKLPRLPRRTLPNPRLPRLQIPEFFSYSPSASFKFVVVDFGFFFCFLGLLQGFEDLLLEGVPWQQRSASITSERTASGCFHHITTHQLQIAIPFFSRTAPPTRLCDGHTPLFSQPSSILPFPATTCPYRGELSSGVGS